jgi:hypothetical protein
MGRESLSKSRAQFILLTAAHVLDAGDDSDLYAGVNSSFVSLDGMWYRTHLPPSGNREHDKVDIGYCVLEDEETLSELQSSDRVLHRSDVILDEPFPGLKSPCVWIPCDENRVRKRPFRNHRFNIGGRDTKSRPRSMRKLGLNPKVNIAMRYNRKTNVQSTARPHHDSIQKFAGMSGGGIYVESYP